MEGIDIMFDEFEKKAISTRFKEKVYKIETNKEKIIMNGKYVFKRREYIFGFDFEIFPDDFFLDEMFVVERIDAELSEKKKYDYMSFSFGTAWKFQEFR